MGDIAIEVAHVWKKFRRGEIHDSLRDLVPALARRLVGRGRKNNEFGKQDFWALKDVSLQVRRGEAVGIIGPNGAGKSTLLKILSRILRPNRGHYRINGRLCALIDVSAGFHEDLTGRENLYLNGSIVGMKNHEIDNKFEEIVDFSGIEAFIDTPIKRYSSGMRARLGFSIMAHMDPDILLVDEVLSVGDAAFRAKCLSHMEKMVRSGLGVVFVSHNLEQVRHLCERCLVLDQGAVQFVGNAQHGCKVYTQSLQNRSTRNTEDSDRFSPGRLLGVKVVDHTGTPSLTVPSNQPISLEIAFVMNENLQEVGLGVSFYSADGKFLTNCNTVADEMILPCSVGKHKVLLSIGGLPLPGGEYLIGIRLFDMNGHQTLDCHDKRYPLAVVGPGDPANTIFLAHEWRLNGNTP